MDGLGALSQAIFVWRPSRSDRVFPHRPGNGEVDREQAFRRDLASAQPGKGGACLLKRRQEVEHVRHPLDWPGAVHEAAEGFQGGGNPEVA
jgi:hypothetical protein